MKDPIVVNDIACATNSTIDQALLVEENKKLKELLSTSNKGKTLDEILANTKVRAPKQGIGYDPKNNKKSAIPPKKIDFVKEGHKVDGKVKKNVVKGEPQGATPITTHQEN